LIVSVFLNEGFIGLLAGLDKFMVSSISLYGECADNLPRKPASSPNEMLFLTRLYDNVKMTG